MPNYLTYEDAETLFAKVGRELELRIEKYSTMPPFEDFELGVIVQYVGPTTRLYTNGYFYKRTSIGWEQRNVQPSDSGSGEQSDWNQDDPNEPDYIRNKPGIASENENGLLSKEDKKKIDRLRDAAYKKVSNEVSEDNEDLVTSGGVFEAIKDLDDIKPLNSEEEAVIIGYLNND